MNSSNSFEARLRIGIASRNVTSTDTIRFDARGRGSCERRAGQGRSRVRTAAKRNEGSAYSLSTTLNGTRAVNSGCPGEEMTASYLPIGSRFRLVSSVHGTVTWLRPGTVTPFGSR